MEVDMKIRNYSPGDEAKICEIYNYYIAETVVTFEEDALTENQMRDRIESYITNYPWFVCEIDGQVIGYSYASKFHQRGAYRHTAETTVYVRKGFERRGIGKALYAPLLAHLADHGCHAVLAVIALPNVGSVGLHEALNFNKVGHLSEVGQKFNQWVDVGYWQRLREQWLTPTLRDFLCPFAALILWHKKPLRSGST
jgi:L-amino acid N-acyltransferase YncA